MALTSSTNIQRNNWNLTQNISQEWGVGEEVHSLKFILWDAGRFFTVWTTREAQEYWSG